MEDRQRGRSRREEQEQKKGRPGCLMLAVFLILVVVIGIFYMVSCVKGDTKPSDGIVYETAGQPETAFFPGDGTTKTPALVPESETAVQEEQQDGKADIESKLKMMSMEEKVLQLFMITPEALTGMNEVFAAGETTKEAVNQYPVGGIIYFKQNLKSPEQVAEMLANTQKYAKERMGIAMLFSIDEEGGQVSRIGGRPEFQIPALPMLSEIGMTKDAQKAYEVGNQIGTYLSGMGFNMDFAPVADVLTNPNNTVVAKRSFGSDGAVVSEMVKQEMKGLKAQGIVPVLKHFPGHGGTAGDTHEGYAYTERTLEELMAEELVPFKDGIAAGAPVIMAAHISAPAVTGDNTPASLSKILITDVLREKMGFDGVVITDALNMGAITNQYTSSQAAVKSIQAGADILLMPADFKEAYAGVLTAVQDGTISEERIEQSVRRILLLKEGM